MKLSLSSYLDTVQLLQHYRGTHEENRTFALKHEEFASSPLAMVLAWSASNRFQISPSGHSPKYQKHWTAMTQFLAFWFLVLGFVTGLGLLSYSGEAPVNVIYYLFIAMVLPIVGMLLSLLSLKSGKNLGDFFAHFFPLYWFEKMMQALSSQYRRTWERTSTLPTSVQRWLFIERLQLFSLLFSVGLLLALLIMVVVKDIAFGWSTTLNVTPEAFHALLSIVGWGWHGWLPSAVPSIELVELSQYFRLGERLETEMVNNANRLGAWWQFLAMTTLVYAIGLRLLFWGVTHWGFQRVLEHAFMRIEGVERLQRHFETPFVTTQAPQIEEHLPLTQADEKQTTQVQQYDYASILGWNFSLDEMLLANDTLTLQSNRVQEVGGSHTFSEDEAIAEVSNGKVLLYVKAWEPPTMDFVDFLELLDANGKIERITLYPLGTPTHAYQSDLNDVAVWKRKVQGLESAKVWIIDAHE